MDVTLAEVLRLSGSGISVAILWRYGAPVAKWLKSLRDTQAKGDASVLAADVTGRRGVERERVIQEGESDRAEISGAQAIVSAATAWGVAVADQHRKCEEDRRRDQQECDERITALERRLGMERTPLTGTRATPPPKKPDTRRE